MRCRRTQVKFIHTLLLLAVFLLAPGCVYNLSLKRSSPLQVNLKDYQPLALLPIRDAPGYPESGARLDIELWDLLASKGYSLVNPKEVSQVLEEFPSDQKLSSDQDLVQKIRPRLRAKILVVGTLLEYHVQKSYVRSQAFQVWEGPRYDYQFLPTYHQSMCQIKLMLRMLDMENGAVVWLAEGRADGPTHSADEMGKRLVDLLLEQIPPLPPKPQG